jgi:hypothetical protein
MTISKVGLAIGLLSICTVAHAGEVSLGGGSTFMRGGSDGPAYEARWRPLDGGLSPYASVAGQVGHITIVSLGAGWRFSRGPWYVEPALGVAAHFGDRPADFGSVGLFQFSGAVGYHVTPRLGVELAVSHWSNGFLAKPDNGLNVALVRLAWRY